MQKARGVPRYSSMPKMIRILLDLIRVEASHSLEGNSYLRLKQSQGRADLLPAKNPNKFMLLAEKSCIF